MKLYDIQLCKKEDYEQLIEFISDYWNQIIFLSGQKKYLNFSTAMLMTGIMILS